MTPRTCVSPGMRNVAECRWPLCDPARPQPTAKLRASQYRAPAAVRRERDGSANVQLTYCYRDRRRYSPGCRFFSPPRLVGRGAKRTYFAVEEWGGAAQQYGGISRSPRLWRFAQAHANLTFSGRVFGVPDAAGLGTFIGKPYVWAKAYPPGVGRGFCFSSPRQA